MNFHCSHSTSRHICWRDECLDICNEAMDSAFVLYIGRFRMMYRVTPGDLEHQIQKKNAKARSSFYWWLFFLCVLFGLRGGSDPFLRWQRVPPSHFWEISVSTCRNRDLQRNETEVEIQKLNINSDDAEVLMVLHGWIKRLDLGGVFFYCFFCFLVCIPIWGRFLIWGYDPIWLIFFKWVGSTTK